MTASRISELNITKYNEYCCSVFKIITAKVKWITWQQFKNQIRQKWWINWLTRIYCPFNNNLKWSDLHSVYKCTYTVRNFTPFEINKIKIAGWMSDPWLKRVLRKVEARFENCSIKIAKPQSTNDSKLYNILFHSLKKNYSSQLNYIQKYASILQT